MSLYISVLVADSTFDDIWWITIYIQDQMLCTLANGGWIVTQFVHKNEADAAKIHALI
jgi:hypothetical protein